MCIFLALHSVPIAYGNLVDHCTVVGAPSMCIFLALHSVPIAYGNLVDHCTVVGARQCVYF